MPKIRIEEVYDALPDAADLDRPQAMVEQWGTVAHLMKVCRMSKSAAGNNLAKLKSEKRAHIAGYVPAVNAGQQSAIWIKGPGEDAERYCISAEATRERQRAANRKARDKKRYDEAQPGRALEIARGTIERTLAGEPRSPFSHLFELAGDKP